MRARCACLDEARVERHHRLVVGGSATGGRLPVPAVIASAASLVVACGIALALAGIATAGQRVGSSASGSRADTYPGGTEQISFMVQG